MENNINVRHDAENNRFYAVVDDHESYLEYRHRGDMIIEYFFTFTPIPLRGRRVASGIVETALDYAKKNNLQVIPSCSFVDKYISQNSVYRDIRVKDFDKVMKA